MDFLTKLLDLAEKVDAPELIAQTVALVKEIKAAADRAPHVLNEADTAELDQIHTDALAANDRLDAALAAAEKR